MHDGRWPASGHARECRVHLAASAERQRDADEGDDQTDDGQTAQHLTEQHRPFDGAERRGEEEQTAHLRLGRGG